jgi:hypothetical protein
MSTLPRVFHGIPKGYITLKKAATTIKCKVRTIRKGIEYNIIPHARATGLGKGMARIIIASSDIPKIKKNLQKIRDEINSELSQYNAPIVQIKKISQTTKKMPKRQEIIKLINTLVMQLA